MAAYYAKHAAQIAMNKQVVAKWNEAIEERRRVGVARRRAALKRVK